MLNFFHARKRVIILSLIFLLISSILLFSTQGLINFSGRTLLAKIGKESITKDEFNRTFSLYLQRQKNIKKTDSSYTNNLETEKVFFHHYVNELILQNFIRENNIIVSDASVREMIQTLPMFSHLNSKNGNFDVKQYRLFLAKLGYTPKKFDQIIRHSIAKDRLVDSVLESSITSKIVSEKVALMTNAKYKIQKISFPLEKFKPTITPNEEILMKFYQQNPSLFEVSKKAHIEYIYLDAHKLKVSEPKEEELIEFYNKNIDRYTVPNSVRASHILIEVPQKSNTEAKKSAKLKAESLLIQLRNDPSSFSVLAKKHSNDRSSASNGGDVGYFYQGMMEPNFEKAAFSLKKNEISDVIESEFGYHIICVTDIKTPHTMEFNEVKRQVNSAVIAEKQNKSFLAARDIAVSSTAKDLETLQDLEKETGVKTSHTIIKYSDLSDQPHQLHATIDKILNHREFIRLVFSLDKEKKKYKVIALPIDENKMIVVRLIKCDSAYIPPYKKIVDKVRTTWLHQQSLNLANQKSEVIFKQLQTKKKIIENGYFFEPPIIIDPHTSGFSTEEQQAILAIQEPQLKKGSVYIRAKSIDGSFVIYKILSINIDKNHSKSFASQFDQELHLNIAKNEYIAFLNLLKNNTAIKYYDTSKHLMF